MRPYFLNLKLTDDISSNKDLNGNDLQFFACTSTSNETIDLVQKDQPFLHPPPQKKAGILGNLSGEGDHIPSFTKLDRMTYFVGGDREGWVHMDN